ncbi:PIG-L deacetylase family protein [Maribacter sp. 4G9]|uniref:PIG-L deacetylase family protein n=1 Tax=Maribacter sp. 4G9 TaxID=1889777 RepID=UPI000C148564|nr:PIG-L family deacetylase [Maribacter sp. 4G9]PIB38450.1 GlcNAc-PI de-N-acetylase [Maribacter sp. 4G9]
MKKLLIIVCMCTGFLIQAQEKKVLNIIAIGAHPDDCDSKFGGTAALFAKMGHKVKFVSLTNGDAGHQSQGGGALGKRRRAEAKKAGEILGVEYDVLDNHDGELIPTLNVRHQVIRKIREWDADIVLGLRPNDYHPDHRNAGIAVQDAAYLVIVPNVTPDTPPLKKNPVFLYMNDRFQKPYPFSKDIAVVVDEVIDTKVEALAAHDSQMFEWLPWVSGADMSTIPEGKTERFNWLKNRWAKERTWNEIDTKAIKKWYPEADMSDVKHVEFFEVCEYGKQPTDEEIKQLFPMVGKK